MANIGLLGGTFNPVHNGHLILARQAMELCALSEVVFLPSASPPHKESPEIVSFQHRINMLRHALVGERDMSISTIDQAIPPPNYLVETLTNYLGNRGSSDQYFFITGIDAFLEIESWKDFISILQIVNFIVSARPGSDTQAFSRLARKLGYVVERKLWRNLYHSGSLYFLDVDTPEIGSTDIRKRINDLEYLNNVLPQDVLLYIQEHKLYNRVGAGCQTRE